MSLAKYAPIGSPARVQVELQQALEQRFGSKIYRIKDHAWREFGLSYALKREEAKEILSALKTEESFLFNMLIDITAVDWLETREPRFDVIYQLLSLTYYHRLTLKIMVPNTEPELDSVLELWPAANFLEREVWDMFGIRFRGHDDLRRILLYEEFVGHPLRKDYPLRGKQPRVPLRVPELRNEAVDMRREELISLPSRRSGLQSKTKR